MSDEYAQEDVSLQESTSKKRKPRCPKEILKEARKYVGKPKREVKESKAPKIFSSYMALVSSIRESEPSTFEETIEHQVWRESMVEEYSSIMKNDVGSGSET